MRTLSPLGGLQNKPSSPIARRANNGGPLRSSSSAARLPSPFGHQAVQASLKLLKRRALARAPDLERCCPAPSAVEARAVAVGAGAAVVEARAGGVGAGAALAARSV